MRIIPAPALAFDSCRCEAMCSEEPELACEAHQEFVKNTEASAGRLTNGSDLTNKREKQSMNFLTLSLIVYQ